MPTLAELKATALALIADIATPSAIAVINTRLDALESVGPTDRVGAIITSPANHTTPEGVPYSGQGVANEAVTWSKSGPNADLITLNAATGAWTLFAQDFNVRPSVSWNLIATDGGGNVTTQPKIITIADVVQADPEIDPRPVWLTPETQTIAENTAFALDLQTNEPCDFEIIGTEDDDQHGIADTPADATAWDFEDPTDVLKDHIVRVTVRAKSKATGLTRDRTFVITVTNVVEDTTPEVFSFIDITGAATSTDYISNSVQIKGIDGPVAISITGAGATYSIDNGAFTASPGTVNPLQSVRVKKPSSASTSTAVDAVLAVGGISDTFTVTTAATSGGDSLWDQPDAIDNAAWTKVGVTVVPNQDGTLDLAYPTTSGNYRQFRQLDDFVAGTTYEIEFKAKAAGKSWAVACFDNAFTGYANAWFDLDTGAVGTKSASVTASITPLGGGVYLCKARKVAVGTGSGWNAIEAVDADNSRTSTTVGTNGVLFGGATLKVV